MLKVRKRLFKRKILLLWYSIDENFGDYYICETVKRYIEGWGYKCIAMEVGLPYDEIAEVAKKCEFLWFAGGGIIERGMPSILSEFIKFHEKSGFIKYGITGLSIGGFDYSDKRTVLKYWVNNSLFFYTRDSYSARELNHLANSNKAKDSVDVVFAKDIKRRYENIEKRGKIGINFRDLPYPDLSGEFEWDRWNKEISNIGYDIIGIPDQYDFSEKVNFMVDKSYSPDGALTIIAKCDIVVAMRFHVILMAARMGKIPIPINYCPKVERLAEQLGISDLLLSVHDYNKLKNTIDLAIEQKSKYARIISDHISDYEDRAGLLFDEIKYSLQKEI